MNPITRLLFRGTLAVVEASLRNHAPVDGPDCVICATCRPVRPWPCPHYLTMDAHAADLRFRLETT